MQDNHLHDLTPTDLIFLQKHLKLGKSHLKQYLTNSEIETILQFGTVNQKSKTALLPDKIELSERITLILNTILTAILGSCLGFSGFMNFKLNSISLFVSVLTFSLLLGGFLGYQNFQFLKKIIKKAFEKRELQATELIILKILNKKRKDAIEIINNELDEALEFLDIKTDLHSSPLETLNVHELGLSWLDQLTEKIRENPLYKSNSMYQMVLLEIEKIKSSFVKKVTHDESSQQKNKKFKELLNKLTQSSIQPNHSIKSWIKTNARILLITAIPTILGGFSSLFVYMGGAPRFAKELGNESIFQFLIQPEIKIIQLILALFIVIYFGYSSCRANYKNFKRAQEIENANIAIVREENTFSLSDDNLLKIKALHELMIRIVHIFHLFKKDDVHKDLNAKVKSSSSFKL